MNPYLIIGALVAVIASFIAGGVVGYEYRAGKAPAELLAQRTVDTEACNKSQAITKGSNDALQKNRDAIAAKLADILRKPAACVPIAGTSHVRASGSEHAAAYAGSPVTGLSSDWLNRYAAEAETYRSEVSVCVDFLDKERNIIRN